MSKIQVFFRHGDYYDMYAVKRGQGWERCEGEILEEGLVRKNGKNEPGREGRPNEEIGSGQAVGI
jgi:hypothetical protein